MNRPAGPIALLALSAAESLLALYQWMDLVVLRTGGTPTCAINSTLNCATVWSSDFAHRVHDRLGIPIAGLGLVWGLTAFTVALILTRRLLAQKPFSIAVGAARYLAAAGFFSSITFAVASARTGAFCPTCLGTYALVIAYAVVAWRLLPGDLVPSPSDRVPS